MKSTTCGALVAEADAEQQVDLAFAEVGNAVLAGDADELGLDAEVLAMMSAISTS